MNNDKPARIDDAICTDCFAQGCKHNRHRQNEGRAGFSLTARQGGLEPG